MQWMEPRNEVSREMQYEGSPMSMSSVRSAWTEQLLGIFIDLCSISSTWSPLWLLLLLLFLLLLLLLLCCYCSRLNCCLCVQSRAKQSSVSIGLDFICAPFCSLLKELILPSGTVAQLPSCLTYAQKAPGLPPMHTAVNSNSSNHFGRLPAEGKCANNKNA